MFIVLLFSISSIWASDLVNDTNLSLTSDNNIYNQVNDNNKQMDVYLVVDENTLFYSEKEGYISVNVYDEEGNNVNVGTITFIGVFGHNYTSDVWEGIAESFIQIEDVGQYNITCFYDGKGVYNNATTTFLLTIAIEETACHNLLATRYDDTVYFAGNIITVYEHEIGEIDEGTVSVYVDDKKVGACGVDSRGNFAYIWKSSKNLIGKTINVTIEYTNDLNHYQSSKLSKIFSFKAPKDTTIISNVKPIDNTRKLVTGIINDNDGNAVVGGTLNINNLYSIPVDTNGKYRFYITKNNNKKVNYKIGCFNWGSKADITANKALMNGVKHTPLIDELIDLCKEGIPYIKFGNGNGKTIILSSGTHGGEIASQVACYNLIDLLANFGSDIDGTIYIFPAIYPEAIANNSRTFNGINMNGVANINGSVSNNLIKFAKSVNAAGLGDFHCTRHNDNDTHVNIDIYNYKDFLSFIGESEFPSTHSVLCTLSPTPECFSIAKYIHNQTHYSLIYDSDAGIAYSGAIDDNANILGVPAVTCEALTNHGSIEYGSVEVSFNMMIAFLKYFRFDIVEMITIPLDGNDLIVEFTSPYNYKSCFKHISLSDSSSPPHNFTPTRHEHISKLISDVVTSNPYDNWNNTTLATVNIATYAFNNYNILSLIIKLISIVINIIIAIYEFLVKFIFIFVAVFNL